MIPAEQVSLIIRCFNEEEHIGRLLSGIYKQSLVPHEVILIDSGSTDSTLEIANRFPVKIATIDRTRFSFGRSLNTGIALSVGHFIVIASAHVYPLYRTWIERLIEPLEKDPEIAISYGRQLGLDDSHFSERQILRKWFPTDSTSEQDHPFCNNANAAIRRSIWNDQRYDESLTGLEDLEWAKNAMDAGKKVSYVAEAPVVHVHRESFGQVMNRYRREAIAHKRIFPEQQMGLVRATGLATANIAHDYRYAVKAREFRKNLLAIPMFRLAQFLGTYRGFKQHGPVPDSLRRRFYYPPRPHRQADIAIDQLNDEAIEYGEIEE